MRLRTGPVKTGQLYASGGPCRVLPVGSGVDQPGTDESLPDALQRALKVIARPAASSSDLFEAIMLVLDRGSDEQRTEYATIAHQMESRNPDYAKYLQMRLREKLQPSTKS